jgi:hypothetical protein
VEKRISVEETELTLGTVPSGLMIDLRFMQQAAGQFGNRRNA